MYQGRGITPITLAGAVILTAVLSVGITGITLSTRDISGGNPSRDVPVATAGASIPDKPTHQTTAPFPKHALSSITVLVNQGQALSPFGLKIGDTFLELRTPATADRAAARHRSWRAGLIDTADLLRANGYPPETPFTLVVGGKALTAGNTYRITGDHALRHSPPVDGGGYTVSYEDMPGEQGIWRILKFKNFMLSYGYSPGLRDHLLASVGSEQPPVPNADDDPSNLPSATPSQMDIPVNTMDYPDPQTRAAAIVERVTRSTQAQTALMPTLIEGLRDPSGHVREVSLGMLDTLDGPVPVKTLKNVALHDNEPALRIHALDLLAAREGRGALAILKDARADPDPSVRQAVAQIIDSLSSQESTLATNGR